MIARSFKVLAILCLSLSLGASGACAEGPEDTVRWIYTSLGGLGPAESKSLEYLARPEHRAQYFSARMVALFDANDSYLAALQPPCFEGSLAIPGRDYNVSEIERTLTVTSSDPAPGRRRVTAAFSYYGKPAAITYDFVDEGGYWKIGDIEGPRGRISRLVCAPRGEKERAAEARAKDRRTAKPAEAAAAWQGGEVSYCYRTPGDSFRLDVAADGRARFRLESVQATGYSCKAAGEALWTGEEWVYEAPLSGGPCRMEIFVTAAQGLRLADPDWACKPSLCGVGAQIDGLTFAREAQVTCPADE